MELRFKIPMKKEWILTDDRIIIGNKEYLLSEITDVKEFSKSSKFFNGVIQIKAGNKVISIGYTHKDRIEGQQALEYLLKNCATPIISGRKTLEKINEEISSLPCADLFGTRKEINELPSILAEDEEIKALTSGLTDGNTWLILCTNRRVLMLDKGMVYGLKMIDIPLDRINSITQEKGLMFGKIGITDGATTRTIEKIGKETISFFADTVNKEVEKYKQSKNTPMQTVVNNNVSVADELLKFKELKDIGVLTEEEFNAKKKELLGI